MGIKLAGQGKFKPLIDNIYLLEPTAEAFEYALKGKKVSKLVLKIPYEAI